MVFCRTKRTCDKVADDLVDRGFAAAAVHGDLGQGAREQALRAFRTGKIDVLVATDVAARGIDVAGRHPRRQLPVPRGREHLPAPHRPHRPRGRERRRGHLRRLGRHPEVGADQQGARPAASPSRRRPTRTSRAPVRRPRHPDRHQGAACPALRADPRGPGRRGRSRTSARPAVARPAAHADGRDGASVTAAAPAGRCPGRDSRRADVAAATRRGKRPARPPPRSRRRAGAAEAHRRDPPPHPLAARRGRGRDAAARRPRVRAGRRRGRRAPPAAPRRPSAARRRGRCGGDERARRGEDRARRAATTPPGADALQQATRQTGAVRLLLLADTHLPKRAKDLPAQVWAEVERADLVVHAGDWVVGRAARPARGRARRAAGVLGQQRRPGAAGPAARDRAGRRLEGVRVAVVHETGARTGRERRADGDHPDTDLLVFGHSHIPWDTARPAGCGCSTPARRPTGGVSRPAPTTRRCSPTAACTTSCCTRSRRGEPTAHRQRPPGPATAATPSRRATCRGARRAATPHHEVKIARPGPRSTSRGARHAATPHREA